MEKTCVRPGITYNRDIQCSCPYKGGETSGLVRIKIYLHCILLQCRLVLSPMMLANDRSVVIILFIVQAELAALMYAKSRLVRVRSSDGRLTFGAFGDAEVVSARG